MYKAHIFVDGKRALNTRLNHIPRLGETIRFDGETFAKVIEVCFCLDEHSDNGQRVNIGTETIEEEEQKDEAL